MRGAAVRARVDRARHGVLCGPVDRGAATDLVGGPALTGFVEAGESLDPAAARRHGDAGGAAVTLPPGEDEAADRNRAESPGASRFGWLTQVLCGSPRSINRAYSPANYRH